MRARSIMVALVSLLIMPLSGTSLLIAGPASAQEDQLVAVITGEKSLEACQVQYFDLPEGSAVDEFAGESAERDEGGDLGSTGVPLGPPEPCQGGLVTATVMTQTEATQDVALTENEAQADTGQTVRMIPLSGDAAQDDAAIQSEMDAIHEVFAPDVATEDRPSEPQTDHRKDQRTQHRKDRHNNHRKPHGQDRHQNHHRDHRNAFVSDSTFAYIAPEALDDMVAMAATAVGGCVYPCG